MSVAIGPGTLRVNAVLAAGRVRAVDIESSRPIGLGRYFHGRDPDAVPSLAGQLFSLCGFSHRVAAEAAIAAAQTRAVAADRRRDWCVGLLAERIGELLRACVLGWPQTPRLTGTVTAAAAALRTALSQTRELIGAASAGRVAQSRQTLLASVETLGAMLRQLGVPVEDEAVPAAGSIFALLREDVVSHDVFAAAAPEGLQPSDDAAVVRALRLGGADFARLPALPPRRIETGAFARQWRAPAPPVGALLARFNARARDIVQALAALRAALAEAANGDGADGDEALVAMGADAAGAYAAVESPRGRLYHHLALARDGRVDAYEMLAPTEWNFHPSGPFVASLCGAQVGAGEAARLTIARLAALFDPCIAFHVTCAEECHA
jgi:uptake hydrogenase large subunit